MEHVYVHHSFFNNEIWIYIILPSSGFCYTHTTMLIVLSSDGSHVGWTCSGFWWFAEKTLDP
jgi:hypothetical protein